MTDQAYVSDREMQDLRHEIEAFKREKERVRAIVGRVGGVPTFNTKIFNIFFVIFVLICLGISLVYAWHIHDLETILMELAVAAVSFKLIYLMHSQARVNHFQLWILSSLEWRLNEVVKELDKVKEVAAGEEQ
jgi:Flp pilus assembly protein TadB